MKAALVYEWMRIRTIRSTWWLTGLAVFVGVGISTLFSWGASTEFDNGGPEDLDIAGHLIVTQLAASGEIPNVVCFILAILGIFAWGHEYRHGMVRASLTALNSRTSLWVAKFLVIGLWVAVVSFVTMVLSGLVGTLFLSDYLTVLTAETWQLIGRGVLYGVLLTWLAMAFTALTRSQAFALVTLFLWPLLIENLINLLFFLVPGLRDHNDILRFLPFDAGNQMVNVLSSPDGAFGDPLSALGGTVVFGATAALLMAASYALFLRRDA